MIENVWIEQPPLAPERDALAGQGNKSRTELSSDGSVNVKTTLK